MSKWGNQMKSGSTPSFMRQGSLSFDLTDELITKAISDKAKKKRKEKSKAQRKARKKHN